ncbi:hypothetical protein [Nocardiopsis salina]|uniref:hypothetical protein n=1 Tax=Nocardiopsis salina TaxID=245836 RepID=UPI00034C71D4|nr:hypothetical protein [Nocardiopsis salina]
MSQEPIGGMTPIDESQSLVELGKACLAVVDPDWSQVVLRYAAVAGHESVDLVRRGDDGSERSLDAPGEAIEEARRLRNGMYKEDTGTWFTMRYTINPPGSYGVDFEYDQEPGFDAPFPPAAFVQDLERFPRTEEHIPEWLARTLAQARGEG